LREEVEQPVTREKGRRRVRDAGRAGMERIKTFVAGIFGQHPDGAPLTPLAPAIPACVNTL